METAVTATAIHRVSVIICAYTEERWEDLMRSVSNAAETLIDDDELIVVIDHNAALLARAQREIGESGDRRYKSSPVRKRKASRAPATAGSLVPLVTSLHSWTTMPPCIPAGRRPHQPLCRRRGGGRGRLRPTGVAE